MQPGQLVTLHLPRGRGAEKAKRRPGVVLRWGRDSALVVPVTDARKSTLPTHARLRDFDSGTQRKDALVTCEHLRALAHARIETRQRRLSPVELRHVVRCVQTALGLGSLRPPPAAPRYPRGCWVDVDLDAGVQRALVVSNDVGNYYGRTLLVAPVSPDAELPCPCGEATVDLAAVRVIDVERVQGSAPGPPSELDSPLVAMCSAMLG